MNDMSQGKVSQHPLKTRIDAYMADGPKSLEDVARASGVPLSVFQNIMRGSTRVRGRSIARIEAFLDGKPYEEVVAPERARKPVLLDVASEAILGEIIKDSMGTNRMHPVVAEAMKKLAVLSDQDVEVVLANIIRACVHVIPEGQRVAHMLQLHKIAQESS